MIFTTAMPLNKFFLLAVLLLVAFFLRIWPVFNGSTHFSFDQGLDIIMVKQLVVDHKINLISRYSGLQGVLMGPLWTWFLSPPFFLSAGNPSANVIYLSLFSLTTALLGAYLLTKKLGKTTGILALFFMLFAPAFITGSQVILSPYPLIYLYVFSLIFSVEVFVEKKARFAWLLILLTGIFFQFEIAFAIFSFLAFLSLFVFFRGWWLFKSRSFWMGISLFAVTLIPQILFDLRHHFLISQSLVSFFTGGSNSLYRQSTPFFLRVFQRLYSFYEDATTMAFFGSWYLNLVLLVMATWGWLVAFKKSKKVFLAYFRVLTVTLVTFFVGFSLYPGPIWGWYRAGLPIVYILFLSLPLAVLWQFNRKIRLVIITVLLFLFVPSLNPWGVWQNLVHPTVGGVPTVRNQKMAIDQVYSLAQNRPFNYFVYTPPVYNYIWQHDFWWYGQKKYGYLPTNWETSVPLLGIGREVLRPVTGAGLTFLIIEPDSERPGEAANWVHSYIKFGQIVKNVKLDSDIIIEERQL